MHFMRGGGGYVPDVKQEMLRTLEAISNYIVADATDAEMFAWRVAREIFANTSKVDIEQTIRRLREPKPGE